MDNLIIGLVFGVVVTMLVDSVFGLNNDAITVKTAKPLEPTGVYIKVNPGGVNDTTYIYEVKPN